MNAQCGRCHQLVLPYELTGTLIATASSTHHQYHMHQAKRRDIPFDSVTARTQIAADSYATA